MTTPAPEEQGWHWVDGNKYAVEAMKAYGLTAGLPPPRYRAEFSKIEFKFETDN